MDGAGSGAAWAAPARGPQTAVAVRVRVAAQRAVFGIVCILPLGWRSGSFAFRNIRVPDPECRTGERESAESATETHVEPARFSNVVC
ncbi:hypothetical protein GCM10023080_051890 [Streptomyces pseudoechinosporeus]